jgi:hypothetical protein
MLKFEMFFFGTKRELKYLKRKYAKIIGGRESFPNSGNFLGPHGEKLEFPHPSIMNYVVLHNSSSVPLSKYDLQKLILDAKIFFKQQDIKSIERSVEFYLGKHALQPEIVLYSDSLKEWQERNAEAATQLAKLQSEAKAAAEASRSADTAEASRSADTAEADVFDQFVLILLGLLGLLGLLV